MNSIFKNTLYDCVEYQLKTKRGIEELEIMINSKIEIIKEILNIIQKKIVRLQKDTSSVLEKVSSEEYNIVQDNSAFDDLNIMMNMSQDMDQMRMYGSNIVSPTRPRIESPKTPTSSRSRRDVEIRTEASV